MSGKNKSVKFHLSNLLESSCLSACVAKNSYALKDVKTKGNRSLDGLTGFFRRLTTIYFLTGLMFFPAFLSAQEPSIDLKQIELLIEKIENLAERSEIELDFTDLLDNITFLLDNPVDLNNASFDELKQIIFLTDFQIIKILEYRAKYGNFLTIYELQGVEGLNEETIQLMEPFVKISTEKAREKIKPGDVFNYGKHDFFLRYSRIAEDQNGYESLSDSAKTANPNGYYLGTPSKIYSRYSFNYNNRIRFGITADKDPGEEFFTGTQPKGFDFYSAFASYTGKGVLKEVVVGDYHAGFGQGLTLWTGLAFGKSSEAISMKRNGGGLKPSTSVNENLYMRGVAATFAMQNLELTAFYSSKKVDANIGETDTLSQEIMYVTSLQETGYHRTNAEMEDKNAIGEKLYGVHLGFRKNLYSLGTTIYKTTLDTPVENSGELYEQFLFSGTSNLNGGLDFNFYLKNFNFYGELSASENGGKAFLAGCQANVGPRVAFSVFYRNYGEKYQNLYSNALGENSENNNEKGLYTGVLLRLHKNWAFNGYFDFFSFPWLKYRVDAPSAGNEYSAQLSYQPSRTLELYFRYRYKNKQINSGEEALLQQISATDRQNFRFHVSSEVLPWITLRSRVEYLKYNPGDQTSGEGFLVYQDVMIRPENKPFDVTLRYALFNTDSYDERIYAYENDVLYAFSVPAYYYKGSRFYVLIKYEIARWLDVWVRFAQTVYTNRQTIGSGLDEIEGDTKSEIKAQVRLKF
jgi:hypothetical protein